MEDHYRLEPRMDITNPAPDMNVILSLPMVLDPQRYRGAVLDRSGREMPITDEMVLKACNALAYIRYPFVDITNLPEHS